MSDLPWRTLAISILMVVLLLVTFQNVTAALSTPPTPAIHLAYFSMAGCPVCTRVNGYLEGVDYKDVTSKATTFIDKFDITYPNGPDPYSKISGAYGITGVPETFLIARDGHVVGWYRGPVTEASLRAALEELLQ